MGNYHNHKDFVCPICDKDFKKERQLKQHTKDTHPNTSDIEKRIHIMINNKGNDRR